MQAPVHNDLPYHAFWKANQLTSLIGCKLEPISLTLFKSQVIRLYEPLSVSL